MQPELANSQDGLAAIHLVNVCIIIILKVIYFYSLGTCNHNYNSPLNLEFQKPANCVLAHLYIWLQSKLYISVLLHIDAQ